MNAPPNSPDVTPGRSRSLLEATTVGGIVVVLALLTCLFIVALPMLGSLALAASILAVFAGAGLAALFALSRM